MRFIIVLFSFMLAFIKCNVAQYTLMGTDRPGLKWEQLKSKHLKVIYPIGYYQQAKTVADTFHMYYPRLSRSLAHKMRRAKIILHPENAQSNGWVVWAPKRSEFLLVPPQETYSQTWLSQLTIHEMRHWAQLDKLDTDNNHIFSIAFGQMWNGIVMAGLQIPDWFFEGDAVATETALSNSGRGRNPDFAMGLKAQLIEKGTFSYHKAIFGSYRDFVPNHYHLGYFLVAKTRKDYGPLVFAKVLEHVASKPLADFSFSKGLKKTTSKKLQSFYKTTMFDLQNEFKKEWEPFDSLAKRITLPSNKQINYLCPTVLGPDTVLVLKYTRDKVPEIIYIVNSKEIPVVKPGFTTDLQFSASHEKIAWTEISLTRFEHSSYSDIIVYDRYTKVKSRLTTDKKYYSPCLSEDGNTIVAVQVHSDLSQSLDWINVATGYTEVSVPFGYGVELQHPSFAGSASEVVFTKLTAEGKSVVLIHLDKGKETILIPAGHRQIEFPKFCNGRLYFKSNFGTSSNVYSMDTSELYFSQETFAQYGADRFFVQEKEESILFSDYTSNGYMLSKRPVSHSFINQSETSFILELANVLTGQEQKLEKENLKGNVDSILPIPLERKPYSKTAHLFNIHSWLPFPVFSETFGLQPGITLATQNDLSTAAGIFSYTYDDTYKSRYNASLMYLGWYPVISAGISSDIKKLEFTEAGADLEGEMRIDKVFAGLSLPFIFNRGLYLYQSSLECSFYTVQQKEMERMPINYFKNDYQYFELGFTFSRKYKSTELGLAPKFAQKFDLRFKTAPWNNSGIDYSKMVSAYFDTYFPGLFPCHSTRVYLGFTDHGSAQNILDDEILFPLGYTKPLYRSLAVSKIAYRFPLAYPDFSIPGFLFVKRVSSSFFADFATVSIQSKPGFLSPTDAFKQSNTEYLSYGAGFTFLYHLFNWKIPLNIGFYGGYKQKEEEMFYGVSFAIDLEF